MKNQRKKVVLVTGCSSGLGLAIGDLFVKSEKFNVVLTARRQSFSFLKNRFLNTCHRWVRILDVTDDDQIDSLIDEINSKLGGVDVLINNAGVCYRSCIEQMDEESELHQLRTNYLGPMSLIRAVVPTMREREAGQIINISSVSGMMAMPTMSSYSASKAALESASEALWYEVREFGIKVCVIQPGFINSASFRNVIFSPKTKLSQELDGPYHLLFTKMSLFIEKLMQKSRASPNQIAKQILGLIEKKDPPLWNTVTFDAKLFYFLRKILPKNLFHRIMFHLLPQWSVNSEVQKLNQLTQPSQILT